MNQDLIIGIQDMGAAGLTCSTTEMASNSGSGIEIDLDLVPQREEGMTPYEIMLSESQERMLIVAKKDKVHEVQEIFKKWDLDAVIIGKVVEGNILKVNFEGKNVVELPVDAIVNLCPVYDRKSESPSYLETSNKLDSIPSPEDMQETFLKMLSSPSISDKEWVFRQYDHMVQTDTVLLPGSDAAILRVKNSDRALAITLDGNPLYTYLDPETGGKIAVAEACRNLACVGAYPAGVTNCLNFGNPEKPEIMWQFQKAIDGISQACSIFQIPVTGGNVSFYNETEGAAVHPTPVLGVVGIIPDLSKAVSPGFKGEETSIVLLGENEEELGASEYLRYIFGLEKGQPPQIDLNNEKKVQDLCLEAISQELILSAHDTSEGGLLTCLAECCFLSGNKIGCEIHMDDEIRTDALLFGETQSRIVVTVDKKNLSLLLKLAEKCGVRAQVIGKTGGEQILVYHQDQKQVDISVKAAFNVWKNSIPEKFKVN
jgi:phosphoribosylformylglycinamidine synthase